MHMRWYTLSIFDKDLYEEEKVVGAASGEMTTDGRVV